MKGLAFKAVSLSANAQNSDSNTYHIFVNNPLGLKKPHCRANLGGHIQKYLHLLNYYTVIIEICFQATCK